MGPTVVLLENLAEPAVAHDHPVIEQEQLPVDLTDRYAHTYVNVKKRPLRIAVRRQHTTSTETLSIACVTTGDANGYVNDIHRLPMEGRPVGTSEGRGTFEGEGGCSRGVV